MIVALEAVMIAASSFNSENNNIFYPYWKTIAYHLINEYYQENSYQTGAKMFAGLSLDGESDEEGLENNELLGEEDEITSSNYLGIDLSKLINDQRLNLNKDQRLFLDLYLQNLEVKEIANLTGWSLSKTYYTFNGVKAKLARYFKG